MLSYLSDVGRKCRQNVLAHNASKKVRKRKSYDYYELTRITTLRRCCAQQLRYVLDFFGTYGQSSVLLYLKLGCANNL